jgi:hypothetical protein
MASEIEEKLAALRRKLAELEPISKRSRGA